MNQTSKFDTHQIEIILERLDTISKTMGIFCQQWFSHPKIIENNKLYYQNVLKKVSIQLNQVENDFKNDAFTSKCDDNSKTNMIRALKNLKKVSIRLAGIKKSKLIAKELKI